MLAMCVLLSCFYYGLSDACKHALDVITGGNFLEIDEMEYLRIINGLVVFPMCRRSVPGTGCVSLGIE